MRLSRLEEVFTESDLGAPYCTLRVGFPCYDKTEMSLSALIELFGPVFLLHLNPKFRDLNPKSQ